MQYRSRATILGLPLIHIAIGRSTEGGPGRGTARGWIAVGDIAFGVIFALGGLAFGGVSLGGLAVGGICLAGLGIGGYVLGGAAIGVYAVGGLAVAWHAALGGGAFASHYAVGGHAIAEHANDAAAQEFMRTSAMRYGKAIADHARWFIVLAFLPALAGLYRAWKR
jgi:hypothetical protein